ncbi:TIGR03032 family protein [Anabaena sp. UHCC 0399]|uniref:TIGR03032 family protein n=1 Tax=Anabaena sp. UHCC 0399 TaxID=3110238 RepID=UPI002B2175B4|nr:TIGR03032 family protein [Anabaena sp. UHCC 0399]MEA5568702.1 TIGR03032 family protein [Anabaena sp. UHCC 0399]
MSTITADSTPSLQIKASQDFASWLEQQNLSLAFTTYQTNRLFFVSGQANGRLKLHERLFDKPMGLCVAANRLYMTTRYQIWDFHNLLDSGEKSQETDRLYLPHTAYTTGDVNAHEIVLDNAGKVIFVNTDFSCLATISPDYSFVPIWQPPFISKLVAEDRCHLNGLAMVEGKPAYVTACSTTDTAAGWRNHRLDGGVVIDVNHNEIIATGLSMPHSPRWYQGKLWLLNSGTGEFGYIQDHQFHPITFCPGFVRGLAFWQNFAFIGLSQLRSQSFTGLTLEKRLMSEGNRPQSGLMVIDLKTGEPLHWLYFQSVIEELFDVVVLPGVHQPQVIGLQEEEIQRLVTFPNSGGIVTTKPTAKRPSKGAKPPIAGLPTSPPAPLLQGEGGNIIAPPFPTREGGLGGLGQTVRYQRVYHLNTSNALNYDELTFPRLQQRWQKTPPKGELTGLSASLDGSIVGFAIAERLNPETAEIISLFVLPEYRKQGIGTRLVAYLERELKTQGCQELVLTYSTSLLTNTALEPLLQKLKWQPPQINGEFRQRNKQIKTPNTTAEMVVLDQPTVQYYALQNLTVEQSLSYNHLSFPKIQPRWSRQQPKGQLVGILAEVAGEKVGLVLAEIFSTPPQTQPEVEVISLFVLPDYRHQGIGTGLIKTLEMGLTALGCGQMKLVYKSTDITNLALEPLLKRQKWQTQVNFLLGKTTTEKVSQAPWLTKYPLPNKFTVFPWSELTDADQKQLEKLDYPAALSPFGKTPAEPLNSLGLRYETELVGWMVTHRVATDAIRYSTMFVDKRFQRLGRGISLLSQSILRQVNSTVPYCLFAVQQENPAMLEFVHKHLEPYLMEVTHSYVAFKQLGG